MPKSYTFALKNVNIGSVHKRYGIHLSTTMSEEDVNIPSHATMIDDLNIETKNTQVVSFLDENKSIRKCILSNIDTDKTKYNCFWDRNPIPKNIKPVGCPINYVHHQAVKTYYSELSKDTYTIKENISEKRICDIKNNPSLSEKLMILQNGYYVIDGIFCSFNCCAAYIEDNKYLTLFKNSQKLLLKMYYDITGQEIEAIEKASSWKTLIEYGGTQTIDQFRNNFNKTIYTHHGTYINYPKAISIGHLYEEHMKF